MKKKVYQSLQLEIKGTGDAPRGKKIYYRCLKCLDVIPSVPKDNCGCKCGNVFIDKDYIRLAVDDISSFQVVQEI
jgi:hypothetical protein